MPDWFTDNAPAAAALSGDDWFASNAPSTLMDPNRRPASTEDYLPPEEDRGSAVGRFLSNAGEMLNPLPAIGGAITAVREKGLGGAVTDLGKSIIGAQVGEFKKAKDLIKEGRYQEAAAHGLAGALPLVGPAAAAAGEQIGSGDVAGGLGKAAGLLAPAAAAAALDALPSKVSTPGLLPVSDADALAFAEKHQIPVDVATATGNKFAKAAQHVVDRTLGGSVVAGKAAQAQAERLATIGEQLAAKAHPVPVTAAEAGEAAQGGVGQLVTGNRLLANDAYDRLRSIEAQTPMAVDVAPVKAALQPIAERLAAKKAVTGALLGTEGRAASTIDALLSAPDALPLSVADSALSDLKQLARTNHPDLRTVGQGIAAKAVADLHSAVSKAAAANPDAAAALNEGRIATKAKYAAADVLKKLEGAQGTKSPVTAFRGLVREGDVSAPHLSEVLSQAPDTKPLIARSVLDGLIDHPTAGPAKTFADWQKLGPETKRLLFSPSHVADLDQFFKLRKMIAENPNPSGTAHNILAAVQAGHVLAEPLSGAAAQTGFGGLSALLHSSRGVRLLTRGLKIPITDKAASAAWLAEVGALTTPNGSRMQTAGAR